MSRLRPVVAALALAGLSAALAPQTLTPSIAILKPVAAVPAHVLAEMQEPSSVARTADGDYLILDRRAHTVFRVDPLGRSVRRLMDVGHEPGRLLRPSVLSMGRDDIFAVLDAPNGLQRIQYFDTAGLHIGGFYLPIVGAPSLVSGNVVVSGVGAMAFTGKTFLVNQPAWGSIVAELDTAGTVLRHVGQLRLTGHERDPDLHQAFNVGLPVAEPAGGFFFVFQTGIPLFRKYSASGQLLFERHIEGPELDPVLQALPNRWLDRPAGTRPFPQPTIQTAAVDGEGRLWVALPTGQVYVYDASGQKIRVVRLQGARPLRPSSFFFTRDRRLVVGPDGYEFETR